VASVKTHWGFGGAPKIDEYVRDFEKMLGWGRSYDGGRSPLEIDLQNIVSAHDKEVPVPKELADAEPGDALDYLRGHSVLRIPDDHVDAVRAALEKEVRQFPSNYFLPENLTDGEVEAVLERVQGIGVTSTELGEMIERKMQNPRAGE
jgi:hypothetical protein